MAAFQYRAVDRAGQSKRGVMTADSARQARQNLRELGLTPVELRDATVGGDHSARNGSRGPQSGRDSLSATALAVLTRQVATLISAGLPVEEALGGVARQSETTKSGRLLAAVREKVVEGQGLATAMGDYPRAFPALYRATVAAGEQSGHLAPVLERLADYTESRQALQQKVLLALFYPALLTVVAVAIVVGLLAYVVPQVVQVFASLKQELPLLTRALIAVSDGLRNHGLSLAVVGGATVALGRWLLRQPTPRQRLQGMLLRLPVVGTLLRSLDGARYTRTLSILLGSGVPMLDSLAIAATVVANDAVRAPLSAAVEQVRQGRSLANALHHSALPPMALQLIASGEASGRLEQLLERAAVQLERDSETRMAALLGLFEPLLILVMGGVVLTIVLAVLLPLFELNQLVR